MKKLICNIGSLALGVLASIMAFVPMFDAVARGNGESSWSGEVFGLFKKPSDLIVTTFDTANDGFKDVFRVIAMVLAIIAIAAFVILAIAIVIDFLSGKKSKMDGIKKIAIFALIIVAVLIAVATIIFMVSNKFEIFNATASIAVSNWFAYLSVILGFAGSGILAMCAKK